MLRIQQVSGRELRQSVNGIAVQTVRKIREMDIPLEGGVDQVIATQIVDNGTVQNVPRGAKVTLSFLRDLIRRHNGDTAKMADELFDESTRERLNSIQKALEDNERKRRAGQPDAEPVTPRSGVDRGVRALCRVVWSASYFARERSVDAWNDSEFGAARFRDTITGDLPTLKSEQSGQTPRYIKFLEDLFGVETEETIEA